jgi:hypothetical protein
VALVVGMQSTVGLYNTSHYFIAHFMLCLFLPFFFYSITGSSPLFWLGVFVTAFFHFGYEFWEDQQTRTIHQLDWDQLIAGTVGLFVAWVVYKNWNAIQEERCRA